MKVMTYQCDRCGEPVEEDNVTKVNVNHGSGRFDLRDEEFELCPLCVEAAVLWMQNKLETDDE